MAFSLRCTSHIFRRIMRTFCSSTRCSSRNPGDVNDHDGIQNKSPAHTSPSEAGGYKDPVEFLRKELKQFGTEVKLPVPRETDICIVGGGLIGLSVAYWLKQRNPQGFNLAVIEKDPTYSRASSVLSLGGIRQQFSLPENVQMSMFSSEFLRNVKEHLGVLEKELPDVHFNPQGYLFLATENGVEHFTRNHEIQIAQGAKVELMSPEKLKKKFPWMNTEDIALGSYGLQNEGWFDPCLLMAALKMKLASMNTTFITGEVVGFDGESQQTIVNGVVRERKRLHIVKVKAQDGLVYPMTFAMCANCAGAWSRDVARLAGIGSGDGPLSVDLPVEPRKRYVYVIHCPDGPGLNMPFMVDPSGIFIRREGLAGYYVCGASPTSDLYDELDYSMQPNYFHEHVLPILIKRMPSFEHAQVKNAWAGYYDYNHFDQNLIIGNHPYHRNFLFANGSSGHGTQHALAIGRALMEFIIDDEFQTIDLSQFSFDRVMDDDPLFEDAIV